MPLGSHISSITSNCYLRGRTSAGQPLLQHDNDPDLIAINESDQVRLSLNMAPVVLPCSKIVFLPYIDRDQETYPICRNLLHGGEDHLILA